MFRLIKAQYGCRCSGCNEYIEPGKEILWSRGQKIVYHPGCRPMTADEFMADLRKQHGRAVITLLEETGSSYIIRFVRGTDGVTFIDEYARGGNKIRRISDSREGTQNA